MYVCSQRVCRSLRKPEGIRAYGLRIIDCEPPCTCWRPNHGLLQGQHVHLTALPPTPHHHFFLDLLHFQSELVHFSLGNLVVPHSRDITISMSGLVGILDWHSALQPRTSGLKHSSCLSLPSVWDDRCVPLCPAPLSFFIAIFNGCKVVF